jgi:hypothetical protein
LLERCPVKETDLRAVSRDADRLLCAVRIDLGWDKSIGGELRLTWLQAGEAQLRTQRDRNDGRWRLEAHLGGNACDEEHDTAWAFRLPIIGLQLGALAVHYSQTHFDAWVDPSLDPEDHDFCVPRPGYNPAALPEARTCNGKRNCKWGDGKPHVIIPGGFYVPPFDAELYEAVRGKRVEIVIGPAHKEEA